MESKNSLEQFFIDHKEYIIKSSIIICALPMIVYILVITPFPPSGNIGRDSWVGFFGSYLGGLLGGIGTLLAVIITTNQTRDIQEENKEETRSIQEENKREMARLNYLEVVKRNKPLVIAEEKDSGSLNGESIRFNIGQANDQNVYLIKITNSGEGLAKNITIEMAKTSGKIVKYRLPNLLQKEKVLKTLIYGLQRCMIQMIHPLIIKRD